MSGTFQIRVAGVVRNDIEIESMSGGFSGGTCRFRIGNVRHEAIFGLDGTPIPTLNQIVEISNDNFSSLTWAGKIWTVTPSGVGEGKSEGVDYLAIDLGQYLNRHAVKINESYSYVYNRNNQPDITAPRYGANRLRWSIWEIMVDVLEHARGVPAAGSGIPDHHIDASAVVRPYVLETELYSWDATEIKNAFGDDLEPGELRINGDRLWAFLTGLAELAPSAGIFIDSSIPGQPKLVVQDFRNSTTSYVFFGQMGFHADNPAYNVIENDLSFTLEGVSNKFVFQGRPVIYMTANPVEQIPIAAVMPPALQGIPDVEQGKLRPVPGTNGKIWRPRHQALAAMFSHVVNGGKDKAELMTPILIRNGEYYGAAFPKGRRTFYLEDNGRIVFTDEIEDLENPNNPNPANAPPIPNETDSLQIFAHFQYPLHITKGPASNAFALGYESDEAIVNEDFVIDPAAVSIPQARLAAPERQHEGVRLKGNRKRGAFPRADNEKREIKIEPAKAAVEQELIISDPVTGRPIVTNVDDLQAQKITDAFHAKLSDIRITGGVTLDGIDLTTYSLRRKVSFSGLIGSRWSDLAAQIMEIIVFPMRNRLRLDFSNDIMFVGANMELRRRQKLEEKAGDNGKIEAKADQSVDRRRPIPAGVGRCSYTKALRNPLADLYGGFIDMRLGKTKRFLDDDENPISGASYPSAPYSIYCVMTLDHNQPYETTPVSGRPKEIGPTFPAKDMTGTIIPEDTIVFCVKILPEGQWMIIITLPSVSIILARTIGGPLVSGSPSSYPSGGFAKYSLQVVQDASNPGGPLSSQIIEATCIQNVIVPKNSNVLVLEIAGIKVFDWVARWLSYGPQPIA